MDDIDDLDDIVEAFLVESHENLDQFDRDLVELERDPSSHELLSSVFRTLHTIKGTSGFLGFAVLESVTHVGESLLSRLRDGETTLSPRTTTVLLEMVDAVRALLAQIEQTGSEGDDDYAALVARLTAILDGDDTSTTTTTSANDELVPVPAAATQQSVGASPWGAAPPQNGLVHADDLAIALAEREFAEPPQPATRTSDDRGYGGVDGSTDNGADDGTLRGVGPDTAVTAPTPRTETRRPVADSSIRVDVALLDSLMNLVGELVLTRNQMLQRAATREDVELQRTTHRLNLIAGELQEGVMKTRMQPIDHVWSKLPRVVRDLSVTLGKAVDLRMEGRHTELDKTILEAVRDPLTHLVRNAVDHGIEDCERRRLAGKPEQGTLLLRAFHEGGQVNIEIADDGAGIDPEKLRAKAVTRGMLTTESAAAMSDREAINLIFSPGFSTAAAVTNVSGRGVGMDVVKTNIEKIGGSIDLTSVVGAGTTVRIRIPLTLAIIPALVVSAAANRYAIPQGNLLELVRLEPEQAQAAIETVHGTPVYRLRGRLLPLVHLREQLELPVAEHATTYIAVLQADDRQFGLIVDDIKDTEEIVVKPLGTQLRAITLYAGATIMGDGQIALILDAMALARRAGITLEGAGTASAAAAGAVSSARAALLVVALGDGRRVAIPLDAVDRLEEFPAGRIERVGSHEVVQYRGQILPLLRLDDALHAYGEGTATGTTQVVVCRSDGRLVGITVAAILDIVEDELAVRSHLDSGGRQGSAVIGQHVTELVDIGSAVATINPELLTPLRAG
ncbi:MAG TPA: chemotaxis protein CheA [Nocardioidaceae bacterium]|nr:chemotaxis protein CheA [Nocardioidaceae bacterium]